MRQFKIFKSITNRDSTSLDKYLQDIAPEKLISAEEEVELARQIKQGDKEALDKLCKANLRFVVSVAKQYQNQGLSLPDLIDEGNIGLIKAAQRFDETRGFKFISYAIWWIRQSILQALAEQSKIVRLPLNKVGALNKIKKTSAELEQLLGRDPSEEEIATYLEIPGYKVEETIRSSFRYISTDTPLSDSDENTFLDIYPDPESPSPEKDILDESLKTEIQRSLDTLSDKERTIIIFYYGLNGQTPMTLEEIGAKLDLTRERVRQIKERAIRRLKHSHRSKNLKAYLG